MFVGRINADKAPEIAVDVAHAAGLPLTMIVKRSEPEEWEYWDKVVPRCLDDDITVIEQPPHHIKVDLLGRARAALCPIHWPEPFGLVLVEALACGTPVITRPLGAAPEIVIDGVTASSATPPPDDRRGCRRRGHLTAAAASTWRRLLGGLDGGGLRADLPIGRAGSRAAGIRRLVAIDRSGAGAAHHTRCPAPLTCKPHLRP